MLVNFYTNIKKKNRFAALQSEKNISLINFNNLIYLYKFSILKNIIKNFFKNFKNCTKKNIITENYYSKTIYDLAITKDYSKVLKKNNETGFVNLARKYFIKKYNI